MLHAVLIEGIAKRGRRDYAEGAPDDLDVGSGELCTVVGKRLIVTNSKTFGILKKETMG
jgi:hypothetical protein